MPNLKRRTTVLPEERWRPPRLRITSDADRESHASWIELFFDLVFVVVVAVLSQNLRLHLSLIGFLQFVALFVPCWWAWVLFTFYVDRYDTDDIPHRLLILIGMLAVVFLAVNARNAFNGSSTGFALAYVGVRSVVLALYARTIHHVPVARANLVLYLASYVPSTSLWLLSTAVAEPWRYVFWAIAVAIELIVPILGSQSLSTTPVHPSHLPERLGLSTLIVLGESIVSVATGTADTNWHVASTIAAVGGFGIAACLWWIYFNFLETSVIIRGISSVHIYNYGHLPILTGLILVAVGTQHVIEEATYSALPTATRWALCGGVALYTIAIAAIRFTVCRKSVIWFPWILGGSVAIALGLAVAGGVMPPLVLEGLLLTMLIAKVSLEIFQIKLTAQRAAPPRDRDSDPERW